MCCSSWGRKESDMTEQLNWTDSLLKVKKKKKKKIPLRKFQDITQCPFCFDLNTSCPFSLSLQDAPSDEEFSPCGTGHFPMSGHSA